MSVTVRRATRGDAKQVAELAMKLVEQHVGYNETRFARIATFEGMQAFYAGQTEAEDTRVLVATVDEEVVGFAYVAYEEKNYAELAVSSAWLHDIYVAEPARHTGAGQALIERSIEAAREFGATKLMLSVAAKNSTARSFFEQAGFETTMYEMMLVVSD